MGLPAMCQSPPDPVECSLAMKQRRLSWFVRAPCLQSVVSRFFLWCPNPPCWWWTGERRLLCWSLSALLKLSYMRNPCKRTTFRVCEAACKFWLRHKRSLEGPWFVVLVSDQCLCLQHSDVMWRLERSRPVEKLPMVEWMWHQRLVGQGAMNVALEWCKRIS